LRKNSIYSVCAYLLVLAGCGGPPPSEEDSPLLAATTTQALDTCTLSSLDWNGGVGTPSTDAQKVCAGPIYYGTQCYEGKTDPLCERPDPAYIKKTCYSDCMVEEFVTIPRNVQITPTVTSARVCEPPVCEDNHCEKPVCYTQYTISYASKCQTEAQNLLNAEVPDPADRGRVGVNYTYPPTYTSDDYPSGTSRTCAITLTNVRKMNPYLSTDPKCAYTGIVCDDTDKPLYSYCRDASFGNAPVEACGAPLRRTGFGASLQGARDEASKEWKDLGYRSASVDFKTAPTCMTCEQETTVSGRFACLDKSLALGNLLTVGADRTLLQQQVVSRMKLLFELEGEQLSEPQRTIARGLYKDFPSLQLSCEAGVGFTALTTDSSCGDMVTLNASLDVCSRLTGNYVPVESANESQAFCSGLLTAVANVPVTATCKGTEYRNAYSSIMYKLTQRQVTSINLDPVTGTLKASDVRRALRYIDNWYAQGRSRLSDETEFRSQLTRLLADFWTTAYSKKVVYAQTLDSSSNEAQINAYLKDVGSKSLQVEREVLTQLFTDDSEGHLMKHEPMLLVMGDGFKGLQQRLTELVPLHDFACRFKQCELPADRSETSLLWALLGAVHDSSLLAEANTLRAPAKTLSPEATAWRGVFSSLANNHSALVMAMQDALLHMPTPGEPADWRSILSSGASTKTPSSAAALSLIIQDAVDRTNSYEKTTYLTPGLRRTLNTGITTAGRTLLIDAIEANNTALANAINTYRTGRHSLITSLQTELNGEANNTRLLNQMRARALTVDQLSLDLQGLRYALDAQEVRFADFSSAFNELLESEKLEGAVTQYQRSAVPLSINGADSEYSTFYIDGGVTHSLTGVQQYAMKDKVKGTGEPWKLTVHPGDLLNLQTTGAWTPTCSLAQAHTINTDTSYIKTQVKLNRSNNGVDELVTTGPEGFSVQWTGSDYVARSNARVKQDGTYYDESESFQSCEGLRASVSVGSPPFPPTGVNISLEYSRSIQECESSSQGRQGSRTESTSTTNGTDTRSAATFSRGLRLSNTPFPSLPVGSLVLVEMPLGVTDLKQVKNLRVIQSGTDSFIPKGTGDSDVYLVVNDNNCGTVPTAHALTVTINRLEPVAGMRSEQLKNAMLQTLVKLRAKELEVLKQGRLLPGDKATLRADAIIALGNLTVEPIEFRQLFEAWLDKEISILEKKVEILTVERALSQLALEMKGLQAEIANAEASSRLYRLSTTWALRDVDSRQLRDANDIANVAIGTMVNQFHPLLELRYPTVLKKMKDEPLYRNQLDAIIDTRVDDGVLTQVSNTSNAMAAIVLAYKNLSGESLIKPGSLVVLRFKRPISTISSTWRSADDMLRAQAIWHAVDTGGQVSLNLTPWDLYTKPTGPAQLGCLEASAVIESMGVHFVWYHPSATQLNGENVRLDVEFDENQLFVTEQGPLSYSLKNNAWRNQSARVTFHGAISQADEMFTQYTLPTRVGEGLSPFTKFAIDFSSLTNAGINLEEADEVLMMFSLAPRSAVSSVKWSGVCN